MSLTRSSALTCLSGMTRRATSLGFSVSRSSMRRLTSGIFDLGADTIRRFETLSDQIRTPCPGGPADDEEALADGDGSGPLGGDEEEERNGPSLRSRDDEEDRLDDEDDGGAGWEFSTRVNSVASSSASACFKGKNSMTDSPAEGTSSSSINSASSRM